MVYLPTLFVVHDQAATIRARRIGEPLQIEDGKKVVASLLRLSH